MFLGFELIGHLCAEIRILEATVQYNEDLSGAGPATDILQEAFNYFTHCFSGRHGGNGTSQALNDVYRIRSVSGLMRLTFRVECGRNTYISHASLWALWSLSGMWL